MTDQVSRPRLAVIAAGALVASGLAGCTPPSVGDELPPSQSSVGESDIVTVERGEISSVLVVRGVTVDRPEYALCTVSGGTVTRTTLREGKPVTAETPVIVQLGEEQITVEHPGVLSRLAVAPGERVGKGISVAAVRHSGLAVQVEVPAEQAYRVATEPISARTTIDGGPGGLDCSLVPMAETVIASTPAAEDDASGSPAADLPGSAAPGAQGAPSAGSVSDAGTPYSAWCLLPLDVEAVPGLSARVGLTMDTREDVLMLPVDSVTGSQGSGEVGLVQPDGSVAVHPVQLGISDGTNIEITDGLEEGDQVSVAAPGFQ